MNYTLSQIEDFSALKQWAHYVHSAYEQKYNGLPYATHLQAVDSVLLRYKIFDLDLRMGAWCHDLIEDTDVTYEQLKMATNERVANMVLAVSEPKTGTRKERHAVTYPKIAVNEDAVTIKLADRISNMEEGGKREMYIKEYPTFRTMLFSPQSSLVIWRMWFDLDALVKTLNPGSTGFDGN